MNGLLKSVLHRMNSDTKIIKIFLKQSERKQRKYNTLTNYLNVLEILKKHGMLWNIISTNLPRKLTINKVDVYNKPEIADAFNNLFTNIGQKLASKYQNHLKHLKLISMKWMS